MSNLLPIRFQADIMWICLAIIGLFVLVIMLKAYWQLQRWLWLKRRPMAYLELIPPSSADSSPEATQRLFNVLHGLRQARPLRDMILRRNTVMALEIVATREDGIRFLVKVPANDAVALQQSITAYLPEIRITGVNNELHPITATSRIVSFRQSGHFAFPLQSQKAIQEHDPVSFITSAMTHLKSGEQFIYQLVVAPVEPPEVLGLTTKILRNEDLLGHLGKSHGRIMNAVFYSCNVMLFALLDGISNVTAPSYSSKTSQNFNNDRLQVAKRLKPARSITQFEQQLVSLTHNKLSQPLFQVDIRLMVNVGDKTDARRRVQTVKAALASFAMPKYQSLQSRRQPLLPALKRYEQRLVSQGLPPLSGKKSSILSTSELAALYHVPSAAMTRTENMVTSLSKTLAAPLSLKDGKSRDVILGKNIHHGTSTDIGLTAAERERHVYIIGGTGNGKTTMLQHAIVEDMQNGKGLAVVDPHGDMAETILRHVPEDRMKDVIYFNPDDLLYPIGLNLLEIKPGLTGTDLLREKDLITESVISVFRKIFSDDDTGGHRIEYVLRNTIQTALTVEGATLFTIFNLLNDPKYRKKITSKLDNPDLVNFWKNEIGKAGEFQRIKMVQGITSKIGRFLFSASAKQILEQPKSTIDFDEILDTGKILICNVSKGLLGEDTSELFGITILAKLQLASLRRARIKQTERQPFYLYVDEFQNFATDSFVQMLSEARKYKLFMLMAEQSTSQQKDQQMVSIILANVGTVICFRTGNPQDEQLLLPLFAPYIGVGEIANLPSFNYFAKLSGVSAQEPLSGRTLLLEDKGSSEIALKVVELSREQYSKNIPEEPEKPTPLPEVVPTTRPGNLYGVNPDQA